MEDPEGNNDGMNAQPEQSEHESQGAPEQSLEKPEKQNVNQEIFQDEEDYLTADHVFLSIIHSHS